VHAPSRVHDDVDRGRLPQGGPLTRFQRCPVGKHWTTVKPVKDSDLTDDDREIAARTRDTRIP